MLCGARVRLCAQFRATPLPPAVIAFPHLPHYLCHALPCCDKRVCVRFKRSGRVSSRREYDRSALSTHAILRGVTQQAARVSRLGALREFRRLKSIRHAQPCCSSNITSSTLATMWGADTSRRRGNGAMANVVHVVTKEPGCESLNPNCRNDSEQRSPPA